MVARDIALVRADRGRDPLPPPVDRRLGRPGAPGQGRGAAGDRRGGPPPLHPDRRRGRRLRPGVQGQPAAAAPADVDAVKAGLADGTIDAIATDHAPHAPELKDLPFDQAPPGMLGLQTALALALTELDLPVERVLALLAGSRRHRRARPGPRRGPGRPIVPGAPANLCVIDPAATLDGGPDRAGQPQPQHALRRADPHRTGPPHRVPGRAGGHRRRGAAVTGRSGTVHRDDALLVLADGAVFEGEAVGARPDGGVATGEAVFNTVLSGYQEVITDPSYAGQVIAFTYPHIGNYGVNPDRRRGARPSLPGGDRPRPHRPARATGGRPESLEDFLDPPRGARHHRGRHPAAHPAPARPRGHALRLRHGRPRRELRRGRRGRAGRPTAWTWWPR